MILSAYQAKQMQIAYDARKKELYVTLDLGITESKINIDGQGFVFPDDQTLDMSDIKKLLKKDTSCFFVENNSLVPIHIFSEKTNKFYKLYPTQGWPSIEISGIRMHVTKGITPKEDTEKKLSFVQPCTGRVLDTCTGLGYTAIMAAKTAEEVCTFEIDENVIELQRVNPYSINLFENSKIRRAQGDIFDEIKKLRSDFFDAVIHDPPRQPLSPMLYSQEFYSELYRVMKKEGKIFHYTGNPGSKKGLDIRTGIARRLEHLKFRNITKVYNGLIAQK